MLKIEIHYKADQEIKEASRYYELQVEGLGDQFLNEIEDGIVQISKLPLAWPVYDGEFRRYLLIYQPG